MNVNSFQDRDYVIPCQALTKQIRLNNHQIRVVISRISSLDDRFLGQKYCQTRPRKANTKKINSSQNVAILND